VRAGEGGRDEANPAINWRELRAGFIEWERCKAGEEQLKLVLRYLDRYVDVIRGPQDVVEVFNRCSSKRNMRMALSLLFRYCELLGYDGGWLQSLRRAMPRVRRGRDLTVVGDEHIVEVLRRCLEPKYRAPFIVVLASGLRVTEAARLMELFDPSKLIALDGGCYRYPLWWHRGCKEAYYAYLSPSAVEALRRHRGVKVRPDNARSYFDKLGLGLKYLRKYAYNKLLELGYPESAADFIQGRSPSTVGGQSYMWRLQQADRYCPRYAEHVEGLLVRSL